MRTGTVWVLSRSRKEGERSVKERGWKSLFLSTLKHKAQSTKRKENEMTGSLVAHVDTALVPEESVLAVPEPEFTSSWHPISHARLIHALEDAAGQSGIRVKSRQYSLSASMMRMFGVWNLEGTVSDGMGGAIGIRNSMDKSMAVGLVAGTNVFVCDNLAFSGEFIQLRRHTSGLVDETLAELCVDAVDRLQEKLLDFAQWHAELEQRDLSLREAKDLTFESMVQGILAPSKFTALHGLYFKEEGKYFDGTLFGWHGAVTELMKGASLFSVSEKNRKLTALLKEFMSEN